MNFESRSGYIPPEYEKPPEPQIDAGAVREYKFDYSGPTVGETDVFDPAQEGGEPIPADVTVEKSADYPNCLKFKLNVGRPDDQRPRREGWIILRLDKPDAGHYAKDAPRRPRDPESVYGNDTAISDPPKVFVENMMSGQDLSDWFSRRHEPSRYKGVGRRLLQLATEWSFQNGCEGRVQLQVQGDSLGFHEGFGFVGQDIYNADGSLHHRGQAIHEQIAIDRYDAAREYEARPGMPWPKARYVKNFGDQKRYVEDRETQMYMFLPPDIIEREKERMTKNPILRVNAPTIEALLGKHEEYKRIQELERHLKIYENLGGKIMVLGQIVGAHVSLGEMEKAHEQVNVISSYLEKIPKTDSDYLHAVETAAHAWRNIGEDGKARELFNVAAQVAEKAGWRSMARKYYEEAGNEEMLRGPYRDPSWREY